MTAPHRVVPTLSFGTYQLLAGEEVEAAVESAAAAGHRVFDTAAVYRNEESVGRALKRTGLRREEYHLTTKLQPSEQLGYDAALRAIAASLKRLDVAYVDCYLMHWPGSAKRRLDSAENAKLRLETWRGMVEAQKQGLTREVGVCNFMVRHFEHLEAAGLPLPQVHQLELHPLCRQTAVVDWCLAKGIVIEAYSPLAQFDRRVVSDARVVKALTPFIEPQSQQQAGDVDSAVTIPQGLIAESFLAWCLWKRYTPLARSRYRSHIDCNAAIAQRFRDAALAPDAAAAAAPPPTAARANNWAVPPPSDRLTQLAIALDDIKPNDEVHVCWHSRDVI